MGHGSLTRTVVLNNVSGMTNTALPARFHRTDSIMTSCSHPSHTKEAIMANTITPTVARDVQMGATVVLGGAEYTIEDEPRYAYSRGFQQVVWVLKAVPAGLKTGILRGDYAVGATEVINVLG